MLITIRHLPDTELRNMRGAIGPECLEIAREVHKNNAYIRVADVAFVDGNVENPLDEAYKLTNSSETPWYLNELIMVTEEAQKGCRSTSVGDLIQINGKSFVVSSYGFEELI